MASSITTLRPPADQEWVGGIVSMPAFVNDADAPYRPEILLWLNADGLVVGTTLGKPGEVLTRASDHLRATIAKPMLGPPHSPARLRVSSDALASALRAGHPSIEITCARAHAIRPGRAAINAWRRHRSRDDGLVFSGRGGALPDEAMEARARRCGPVRYRGITRPRSSGLVGDWADGSEPRVPTLLDHGRLRCLSGRGRVQRKRQRSDHARVPGPQLRARGRHQPRRSQGDLGAQVGGCGATGLPMGGLRRQGHGAEATDGQGARALGRRDV